MSLLKFSKRPYLVDYKPIREAIFSLKTAKNLTLQSTMLCMSPVSAENLAHEVANIQKQQNGEEPADFDWIASISKHAPTWPLLCLKVLTTEIAHRFYQSLAVEKLEARFADKLIKDLDKSLERKLEKHDRLTVCQKIVKTAAFSMVLVSLARLTNDIAYFAGNELYDLYKSKKADLKLVGKKLQSITIFSIQKAILHSTSIVWYSTGYSIVTYLLPRYGSWGGLLLDVFGTSYVNSAVGI